MLAQIKVERVIFEKISDTVAVELSGGGVGLGRLAARGTASLRRGVSGNPLLSD